MTRTTTTGPELFIGLIGALGAPLDEVQASIKRGLERVGYETDVLRLTAGLEGLHARFQVAHSTEAGRLQQLMERGLELRTAARHGRPMAWVGAFMVRAARGPASATARRAYVFRSLKHRDEVGELRRIYGEHFVAVAVHAPRAERVEALAQRLAESGGRPDVPAVASTGPTTTATVATSGAAPIKATPASAGCSAS